MAPRPTTLPVAWTPRQWGRLGLASGRRGHVRTPLQCASRPAGGFRPARAPSVEAPPSSDGAHSCAALTGDAIEQISRSSRSPGTPSMRLVSITPISEEHQVMKSKDRSARIAAGIKKSVFTAEERSAMKQRVQELKEHKGEGESAVLEKIAEMQAADRAMAK